MSHACEATAKSIRKNTKPKSYARWRLIATVTETMRDFSPDGSLPTHIKLKGLSKLLFGFIDESPSPDICEQTLTKMRRSTTWTNLRGDL